MYHFPTPKQSPSSLQTRMWKQLAYLRMPRHIQGQHCSTSEGDSITKDRDLFRISSAFKALRVYCPKRARQLRPSAASLEGLRSIPALDSDAIIRGLQEELPGYLVAAEDVTNCTDRLRWWKDHGELPKWQAAACLVFTMSPSSAAAERLFSLLQAAVHNTHMSMLKIALRVC